MESGHWEGAGGDIKAKSQNPKPKSFVFIVISMRNIATASTRGCRGYRECVGLNQR